MRAAPCCRSASTWPYSCRTPRMCSVHTMHGQDQAVRRALRPAAGAQAPGLPAAGHQERGQQAGERLWRHPAPDHGHLLCAPRCQLRCAAPEAPEPVVVHVLEAACCALLRRAESAPRLTEPCVCAQTWSSTTCAPRIPQQRSARCACLCASAGHHLAGGPGSWAAQRRLHMPGAVEAAPTSSPCRWTSTRCG